jgi:heat shock protein HslJ
MFFLLIISCKILNSGKDEVNINSTKWTITALNQRPFPADKNVYLTFDEAKQKISGKAACNSFSGSFKKEPSGKFVVEDLVSTKKYCEGLMDQENQIMIAIPMINTYEIKAGMLYLYGGQELLMTLKPID